MSSNEGASTKSGGGDVSAKHRKLVANAIMSNAVKLLRKYHEQGVDIRACAVEGGEGDESMILAASK